MSPLILDPWDDDNVPWWALMMVDEGMLNPTERRVRAYRQRGGGSISIPPGRYRAAWEQVVQTIEQTISPLDPGWWIDNYPVRMRKEALRNPRAFCQLCDIPDDMGKTVALADFQVRGIYDIRHNRQWLGLWPFEHGKSYLASVLVPLLDWAEEPECTQIRLYYADSYRLRFARKLMWLISGGAPRLTRLFPWIRKPMSANEKANQPPDFDPAPGQDDPCLGYWSTLAFSIGGKTQADASFRGLSAASGQTGWRAWRVIADDLVNSKNAGSERVQDTLEEFINTGAQTMPLSNPPPTSIYGTRWGTFGLIGTLFHPQDVNNRFYNRWLHDPRAKVTRLDIFPYGPEEDESGNIPVLWPAQRPLAKVLELRELLGADAFNMRCRNIPNAGHGERVFRRGEVEDSKTDLPFGQVPPGAKCIIGFDPAKGKRSIFAKNPALFLIAVHPTTGLHHYVKWARLRGYNQYDQTRVLVNWATEYRCPVAMEDNYDKDVYFEHLKTLDPSGHVRVICHTTTTNKRDPVDGVSRLINLFERRQVRIHTQHCDPQDWTALLTELCNWPNGFYSDLLMALWVGEYQFSLHHQPVPQIKPQVMPSYVTARGLGGMIDLRPFQRRHG